MIFTHGTSPSLQRPDQFPIRFSDRRRVGVPSQMALRGVVGRFSGYSLLHAEASTVDDDELYLVSTSQAGRAIDRFEQLNR